MRITLTLADDLAERAITRSLLSDEAISKLLDQALKDRQGPLEGIVAPNLFLQGEIRGNIAAPLSDVWNAAQ
ncbi:MAG: hypothetical protein LBU43_05365 [Candidatus Accumulibacter sp.]|jgi:hypothetical protein|nr:hypothetical protein [Accumulibacter sp.]